MRVYGDRVRTATARQLLAEVRTRLADAAGQPPGVVRHAGLAGAFVTAGELLQGVADADLQASGVDEPSAAQAEAGGMLMILARALAASWDSGFAQVTALDLPATPALEALGETRLTCKVAEGYAYYAVYPESFYEAARDAGWSAPPQVIGLRSIGASLAAMAAAGADAGAPATLRPVGEPFARRVVPGEGLRRELLADLGRDFAVVDEGPGLSGSSFGCVGDLLEDAGVALDQITFLPSHGGSPGPMASARHRERWRRVRRVWRDVDELAVASGRLAAWVGDLVGPIENLEDISGGGWRRGRAVDAPATPGLERRKFLARTTSGVWLLKFVGLGADGEARAMRAAALAHRGFSAQTLGLRHGFLVESWHDEAAQPDFADRDRLIDTLARYIAFRTEAFPASAEDGASMAELVDMARVNLAEALGDRGAADLVAPAARLAAQDLRPRWTHVDSRLHAWEWLQLRDGAWLKTDAVDHSRAHDLVGCQDPAWDVAGAEVELGLSGSETAELVRRLARLGVVVDPRLLEVHRLCYPAFQLGLWTMAGDGAADVLARYAAALREPAHA